MSQTHEGHRERLRERFRKEGLENFQPHEVLEFLLTYSIARRDTNPIAHNLLDRFGSLEAVLEAPEEELMEVDGIGERSASLIHLMPALSAYYLDDKNSRSHFICDSTAKIGQYLIPKYLGQSEECSYLLSLNNRKQLISCDLVGHGSVSSSPIYFRKVSQILLRHQATAAVISHNHPKGFALPSSEDIHVTRLLADFTRQLEVELLDHIIVSGTDYVSLRESGVFSR